jgi:LAS superfamily LD-carboxypeptidase LdcB
MRIIITEQQLRLLEMSTFISVMINEDDDFNVTNDVLSTYLSGNTELTKIYEQIETELNDKFQSDHFEQEIKYSGGLKDLSGGISETAQTKFDEMVSKLFLKNKVVINQSSYRDYNKQKEIFVKMAKKHGGTISNGLRQAALPGFSQHHTGKALDISNSNLISDKVLNDYGFIRPYKTDTKFRMPESWHIYYKL